MDSRPVLDLFLVFPRRIVSKTNGGGGRVMEHREIPRIVSAEGRPRDARAEPVADRHRFARFVTSPTERRLVLSRLGLAVLAGVCALIAVGVVGAHVLEKMVRWLHGRPQYQTTFGAIELEPAPPAWYR